MDVGRFAPLLCLWLYRNVALTYNRPSAKNKQNSRAQTMTPNDLEALKQNAGKAETLLKAMSNSNRLMILCSLVDNELSVTELNARIPLSQSALSQHLAALRKADLVQTRRESQTIYYRINGMAPTKIIQTLKSLFCAPDQDPEAGGL